MSDVKISQLNVATSASGSDVLPIVQGGDTKQISRNNFMPSLDQIPVPQANVSLNSFYITNLANPSLVQDASTKNYTDAAIASNRIVTNHSIGCTLDGAGSAISTGKVAGYQTVPWSGNITAWSIGVDAGNATMQTWKVKTGTATPTNSNSISTSGVSLSSGTYIRSLNVADFTNTTVANGDIFAFYLSNVATAKELTYQIEITP